MIKEIKIENFKSIASLNLELGRLNVFIGANGSGKSNILEGITFGSCAISDKLENEFLGVRIRVPSPNLIKSAFDSNNIRNEIQITFCGEDKDEDKIELTISFDKKWKTNLRIPSVQTDDSEMQELRKLYKKNFFPKNEELTMQEKLTIAEENLRNLYETEFLYKTIKERILDDINIGKFLIYSPENYFLRRFEDDSQISPLGLRGEGLFSLIAKIAKESPDDFQKINEHLQLLDWFDGFEIPNDLMFTEKRIKIKDQYLEDGLQYFDQRSANEGFLYLLFYLTLFISDETPKFFAIDNIDNAMNPKLGSELIKILAKLAKEHDKQTILTTHNPSVLDGLDLKDDDQRLFVIYRNADGHTKARRIASKEVPNGVESVRLSEAFIRGYIGGLPKNF